MVKEKFDSLFYQHMIELRNSYARLAQFESHNGNEARANDLIAMCKGIAQCIEAYEIVVSEKTKLPESLFPRCEAMNQEE